MVRSHPWLSVLSTRSHSSTDSLPEEIGHSGTIEERLEQDPRFTPAENEQSTLNEEFLAQFEDPKRRMRERARIDPLQTRLSARDAAEWGGVAA